MQALTTKQGLKYLLGAAIVYTIVSLMVALPAMAQTTTGDIYGTTGTTSTSTPGVPVTGVGGDTTTNTWILLGSLVVVAAAGVYLLRRRA